MKSPARLYLTADRLRVVKHGSPESAFLLCIEGEEIPAETVKKYGLDLPAPAPAPAPAEIITRDPEVIQRDPSIIPFKRKKK